MLQLSWLPKAVDWPKGAPELPAGGEQAWDKAIEMANTRLDFIKTQLLDDAIRSLFGDSPPDRRARNQIRLALLGSGTMAHLHAGIRVAGIRRGIPIAVYENNYGQYWQELVDAHSSLYAFRPTAVLLSLDTEHLSAGVSASMPNPNVNAALEAVAARIVECWRLARDRLGCHVIHQIPLNNTPSLLGNNEHRLPGSRRTFIVRLSERLRNCADAEGVDLIGLDSRVAVDGLKAWYSRALWHRGKQEISPTAAPMYGDLVARVLAAKQGRSFKCLVLDLDNTLWGGVVGDDGLHGLKLGQGSAEGEAFTAFQQYARELSRRGVILAVCSKNDEANALEVFDRHPEMVLRRSDIACFAVNWNDKPANLRAIARQLNIGIDSLVFVDDNPFERELVRRELPMVAVPELPEEPAEYAQTLQDAGYFEALTVTAEDRDRGGQYQSNRERAALEASATDLPSYLRRLEMQLIWRRFDQIGLARIVQLINKTNQFNLTTRRYTEADVVALMQNDNAFGLQLRLLDRFGDNGMIAVVIGRLQDKHNVLIDTWLMSCRVLGRQVEVATLNLVASAAERLGARSLIGEYIPTAKNAMVKDHYSKLGFTSVETGAGNASRYRFDLSGFVPAETFIAVAEG